MHGPSPRPAASGACRHGSRGASPSCACSKRALLLGVAAGTSSSRRAVPLRAPLGAKNRAASSMSATSRRGGPLRGRPRRSLFAHVSQPPLVMKRVPGDVLRSRVQRGPRRRRPRFARLREPGRAGIRSSLSLAMASSLCTSRTRSVPTVPVGTAFTRTPARLVSLAAGFRQHPTRSRLRQVVDAIGVLDAVNPDVELIETTQPAVPRGTLSSSESGLAS